MQLDELRVEVSKKDLNLKENCQEIERLKNRMKHNETQFTHLLSQCQDEKN